MPHDIKALPGDPKTLKTLSGKADRDPLTYSLRDRKLVNQRTDDHNHGLAGSSPILALDMYEHSYHMDYGAAAAKDVDAFMENIRWDNVSRLHQRHARRTRRPTP
jgi:superoxide dismutase, Fe-Mn family